MQNLPKGVQILGPELPAFAQVLTPEALAFVAKLHRHFNPTRERLLQRRAERQLELDAGKLPDFLPNSAARGDWQVAPAPPDLQKRWVEITGPTERKMMVNALNSGASVFMADCEDALSPTWANAVEGQLNLINAVRRQIDFVSPEGKAYKLNDKVATLLVRPRGWHLTEKNVLVDDQPISASLFDFGLYFFHNAHELLKRGSGPYFYLPKLESHLEARLWNEVFNLAQDELSVPRGTIRATVLIETIMAAFEMEEILYELRDHMSGLNAGRWDYIFSVIKKFSRRAEFMLPDRAQVTMTVPFMRPYTELLVKTCHKHGAHAIGGMAAFIPSRRDPEVNERALAKVREDKERESSDGFDGTWVAHPDLVPVAWEIFERKLGDKPHQKERLRQDVQIAAKDLVNIQVPGGQITEAGIRLNVNVALQYINSWLDGNGAAAIYNLMEDTATAEISRAQLWQWLCHGAKLDDGRVFTKAMYEQIRTEELAKLGGAGTAHYGEAVAILDELVLNDNFIEFLTFVAYPYLS
ncbi:MAG: malate synthase A [Anaerolineae bacterium]|nr:malate synthase A [Anaerolineales bacterium]MCQ3974036.1 malate synthase A [Anaerolineae bacterium]